jgi:hypothetical protein
MNSRIAFDLIGIVALCLTVGCFSKSSTTQASFESSSKIASSPFKSSSKSSGGDEKKKKDNGDEKKETSFQRDVRNHTAAFARSAGEPDLKSFQRDLSAIAEDHGITNWEQFADTYVAIGWGLADSGLDDWSAQQLATALSDDDIGHLTLVQSGYESRNIQ